MAPVLPSARRTAATRRVASPRYVAWLIALAPFVHTPSASAQAFAARAPIAPAARVAPVARIAPNDNRRPAGRLRGDTLHLAVVATLGEWHPDGDRAPGVTIPAFAEEGRAPSVPGPLVRVRQGSTVTVTVRNALPNDTLRLQGLHPRPFATPADSATLTLLPGERRPPTFTLALPGTFYYWGTTTRRVLAFRTGLDAQLTGAIVVDPRDAPAVPNDRIFVLGMWTDTVARSFLPRHRVLGVVNGRSWPGSERLTASVGDTVRWRVINASGDLHPMHLHGFYFRVTARGDGTTDTLFTADRAPLVVTEAVTMGGTYAMTWVPERAGNWLYHCHIPEHFGPRAPLGLPRDSSTGDAHNAHASHAQSGMSGLVLGVSVRQRAGRAATATAGTGGPPHATSVATPTPTPTPAAVACASSCARTWGAARATRCSRTPSTREAPSRRATADAPHRPRSSSPAMSRCASPS